MYNTHSSIYNNIYIASATDDVREEERDDSGGRCGRRGFSANSILKLSFVTSRISLQLRSSVRPPADRPRFRFIKRHDGPPLLSPTTTPPHIGSHTHARARVLTNNPFTPRETGQYIGTYIGVVWVSGVRANTPRRSFAMLNSVLPLSREA